jgi:hypothetical protein
MHPTQIKLFSCHGLAETVADEGQYRAFRRAHDLNSAVPPFPSYKTCPHAGRATLS